MLISRHRRVGAPCWRVQGGSPGGLRSMQSPQPSAWHSAGTSDFAGLFSFPVHKAQEVTSSTPITSVASQAHHKTRACFYMAPTNHPIRAVPHPTAFWSWFLSSLFGSPGQRTSVSGECPSCCLRTGAGRGGGMSGALCVPVGGPSSGDLGTNPAHCRAIKMAAPMNRAESYQ